MNYFGLWKTKILLHLGNLGLDEVLEREAKMPATCNEEKKKDIMKRAYNTLIFCLNDRMLRKVSKMKSTQRYGSSLRVFT